MKLSLTRTAGHAGLIYEAANETGQTLLKVERGLNESPGVNVWILYFDAEGRRAQAVMQQNSFATEFQEPGGRVIGRIKAARFSIAGKFYVDDESGRRLGSLVSGLSTIKFKDSADREFGIARRSYALKKTRLIPPSKLHTAWNHEVELKHSNYDRRFLLALVCVLVANEFAAHAS
jgi:hypothetical protein